jgi:hypothetical protein
MTEVHTHEQELGSPKTATESSGNCRFVQALLQGLFHILFNVILQLLMMVTHHLHPCSDYEFTVSLSQMSMSHIVECACNFSHTAARYC